MNFEKSTAEDPHGKNKTNLRLRDTSAKKQNKKKKQKMSLETQKSPEKETLRPIKSASEIFASFELVEWISQ